MKNLWAAAPEGLLALSHAQHVLLACWHLINLAMTCRRKHRSSKHRSGEQYDKAPVRREPSGYDDYNRRLPPQIMGPPNRERQAALPTIKRSNYLGWVSFRLKLLC